MDNSTTSNGWQCNPQPRETSTLVMSINDANSILRVPLASGITLPFVDVTHPAFLVDDTRAYLEKWRASIEAPVKKPTSSTSTQAEADPEFYLPGLVERMFGGSTGYLDGWATYLLKIGADNLPPTASDIERTLLSSANAVSLRVRLQQLSHLIADFMTTRQKESSFRLVSLGGGTAIELLNALLIFAKRLGPQALPHIEIAVLDIDSEGSVFGSAALAALQEPGSPLAGIQARLAFHEYSWTEPSSFRGIAAGWRANETCMIVSSEGALFEYASDEIVETNLRFWREAGAQAMAGSAIRADATGNTMVGRSPFALYARSQESIERLAEKTGYRLERAIEGIATDQFIIEPTSLVSQV